jgi:uncharacterized protein with HEPN domain
MSREAPAYLLDIIEACDAIFSALADLDLDAYRGNRLVRSREARSAQVGSESCGRPAHDEVEAGALLSSF